MNPLIIQSQKIIGENKQDDYQLDPGDPIELYQEKSSALAMLLGSSRIKSLTEQYIQYDEAAAIA